MAITPADIKALPSGEFASLADPIIQPFIDEAVREVNASIFGARYDDGVKYLAAHLLAVVRKGSSGGTTGAVVSETVGPLSRTFAAPTVTEQSALQGTVYGRQYQRIQRQVAGGPRVL